MRLSLRHKLMVLVMVAFLCASCYFYIQSNQPAQGEFNYDKPATAADTIDYGDKKFAAAEGMTFVTLTIHAKNTSVEKGYSTNPLAWELLGEGKAYGCHFSATYNHPAYADTYDIVDTATFVIIFEVPSFAGEIPYLLKYDGNFRAAYNPNLLL